MPSISKEQQDEEYESLLTMFISYLKSRGQQAKWQALCLLMRQRAFYLVSHALSGIEVTLDEVKRLLDSNDLSMQDRNKKRSILAAIANLVDFAVAEEYQMSIELLEDEEYEDEEYEDDEDKDESDDDIPDAYVYNEKIFRRYNKRYALVENLDVIFAMSIACTLSKFSDSAILVYETQGDNRVRPWHAAWEGFSAPKREFPEWLIPPIEPGCRCYLTEETADGKLLVFDDIAPITKPDWINPAYKESVAMGGKIFSDEHPYFDINLIDAERVRDASKSIYKDIMQWLVE